MKLIKIGKIVNTHGIKGEIRILSKFPYKDKVFIKGMTIYIDKNNIEKIVTYRRHKNFDMITMEGYSNINEVLKYKGMDVYVNEEDIKLDNGNYLDEQLIGLSVIYEDKEQGIINNIERYDKMCLFTHSTIVVNAMIEIEKDDDLDIYVIALKQNAYFVEMLLYLCLKYLCNYDKDPINITYVVLGWYVLISDVPKEKVTPEKMEKLNKLLYADFNKEYLEKNKENIDFLTEEAKKLQEDIQKNPTGFVELLTSLVK